MADLADVEKAPAALVAVVCCPDGIPAGEAPPSPTVGAPVRVRCGWPDASKLDADLARSLVNISVFSMPGMSPVTSRYLDDLQPVGSPPPTLTFAVDGPRVSFGGSGGPGQLVGVLVGGATRSVPAAGAPEDVAAALAASFPAWLPAAQC